MSELEKWLPEPGATPLFGIDRTGGSVTLKDRMTPEQWDEYTRRTNYEELWQLEVQRANIAVQKALSSYRWWGWTNIANNVRLFIQAWRIRLGFYKLP